MAFNKDSVVGTMLVAFLVCVVCGVVVATAAVSLRPLQVENQRLDKRANILKAAGLYERGVDIDEVFKRIDHRYVDLETGEYVEMPADYDQRRASRDPAQSIRIAGDDDVASIRRRAKVAEVFLARDDEGELTYIILPVHGYGLWSTMYGFLALKPDANTVSGLGFYDHGETPGLGGEIDNPRWQAQWEGKQLFGEDGSVKIQVVKGSVDSNTPDHEYKIDGLAGATLTSNGVTYMLRYWLGENGFGPYLQRMQEGADTGPLSETDLEPQEGEA